MRIRKRTPARAASPGPAAPLQATYPPPPPPPPQRKQHPKQDRPQEEQEEEKASLVVGVGEQEVDLVLPAASKNRAMGVPKPDPEPAARPVRCSRNDGKRWRCKGAAVPGYLFCDRHIAWATRKRKPRASKKNRGGSILDDSERTKEEPAEEEENKEDAAEEEEEAVGKDEAAMTANLRCDGDYGLYYYGGFQPGSRKRAKSSAAGPAA